MPARYRLARDPHRPLRLGVVTSLLLVPLLVILHAPLIAALVPGALVTAVQMFEARDQPKALPSAELVDPHDLHEVARVDRAQPVEGHSRRLS